MNTDKITLPGAVKCDRCKDFKESIQFIDPNTQDFSVLCYDCVHEIMSKHYMFFQGDKNFGKHKI